MEASLRDAGNHPYSIPEGGSNALGAWGYVRMVEELAAQIGDQQATLVYAAGSGGTGAGLILGVKLTDSRGESLVSTCATTESILCG